MSSALSITEAVNPPRAVYLDYPLGHTAGRKRNKNEQDAIMTETLKTFASATSSKVSHLPFEWATDHVWKDTVMRPQAGSSQSATATTHADNRGERFDTPQYQNQLDADAVDPNCPTCVFLSDTKIV